MRSLNKPPIVFGLYILIILLPGLTYTPAHANTQAPNADAANWIDLFNGKNLDGWTAKIRGYPHGENFAETFRVKDGNLAVNYSGYADFDNKFGHLFYQTPYSHYVLEIEYRFIGEQQSGGPKGWAERNSGVMVHAQAPHTMALMQDFPISIEAQFLGGLSDGKARPTGNVCTPGTEIEIPLPTRDEKVSQLQHATFSARTPNNIVYAHHCLPSTSATYDGDQWVKMVVVVLGAGSITHYVNDKLVLKYFHPGLTPPLDAQATDQSGSTPTTLRKKKIGLHAHQVLDQGYIALQSESHPVEFRRVRLLNLAGCTDQSAANYANHFIKSEPDQCIYEP